MSKPQLIIFLRKPELGKVKTRLAATLGAEKALAVYGTLLRHTLECAAQLDVERVAWTTGNGDVTELLAPFDFAIHEQDGNDLGERMEFAFEQAFTKGNSPVVIIGTDCPGISQELLEQALAALQDHDAVLGPARDGGYYLLGLKRPFNAVFRGIQWSTDTVAQDTINVLKSHALTVQLLPVLIDVDTEQDLRDTYRK